MKELQQVRISYSAITVFVFISQSELVMRNKEIVFNTPDIRFRVPHLCLR